MSDRSVELRITAAISGQRLDKVIADANPDWSRTQVQQWIAEERVWVNGENRKGNYRVKESDQVLISIPAPQPLTLQPESIPLDIRYEDRDLLIVNKPPGMVVHPSAGHYSGTLVHALLAHCAGELSGIGGYTRPGIVHRLDKDTSGLMVVAKNDPTHQALVKLLQQRAITRIYLALVQRVIQHDEGTIRTLIGRDPTDRKRMAVVPAQGKEAVTHFTVQQRFAAHTLVSCQLETGRTHQIRVHMKYIQHPIVGDPTYGGKGNHPPFHRQALHAYRLQLPHPRTGEMLQIEVDPPDDFQQLQKQLA